MRTEHRIGACNPVDEARFPSQISSFRTMVRLWATVRLAFVDHGALTWVASHVGLSVQSPVARELEVPGPCSKVTLRGQCGHATIRLLRAAAALTPASRVAAGH